MNAIRASLVIVTGLFGACPSLAQDAPPPDPNAVQSTQLPDAAPNAGGPVERSDKVVVSDLNVVDGDPVGTLDDTSGSLGSDMWMNVPRGELERLVEATPIASRIRVVRDLSRRLMLTPSESPAGTGKRALVAIRIQKFLEGGFISDADQLALKVHLPKNPDVARMQANAILLAGDTARACGDVTAHRLSDGDAFWLQLRAYCFAVAHTQAQADLIDQLLDAQGETDKAYLILRNDVLKHQSTAPGAIPNATPMHVFLFKAAKLKIPPAIAAQFHLASAPVLANPDTDIAPEEEFPATTDAPTSSQRYALHSGLAQALGASISYDENQDVAGAATTHWIGARPPESEMQKIADAAVQPARRGEAILRILEAVDQRGLEGMAPDISIRFVQTLKQIGLDAEAKQLAVQALHDYREPVSPAPAPTP
ncbi:MAG TPA: hypothetical protein VGG10_15755 [Rhizomicrobium sp.]|jgi:hypothetical protein